MRSGARVALAAMFLALLSGCGSHQGAPDGERSPSASDTTKLPSVDELYALAGRSLRADEIYHVTISAKWDVSDNYTTTRELWVDAAHDTAREKQTSPREHNRTGTRTTLGLVGDGVRWVAGKPQQSVACHGQNSSVGAVLGCPEFAAQATARVERGQFQGRAALVLVSHQVSSSEDEIVTDVRTYLDPATGLPEAARQTRSGTADDGSPVTVHAALSYRSDTAAADTLAAGFFDPAALGWQVPDPVADLPTTAPVYWLGPTYDPGGRLPSISLSSVKSGSRIGAGYAAILTYTATADRFGPPVLDLQLWTRAAWDSARIIMGGRVGKCPGVSELKVDSAQLTMRCTKVDNEITAFAQYGNAVVILNAPSVRGPSGSIRSPYDTRDALIKAVGDLRLR
jgi:hypothetical protein